MAPDTSKCWHRIKDSTCVNPKRVLSDQVYCANFVEPHPKVYGAASMARLHESGQPRMRRGGTLASMPRDLVPDCVLTFLGCWAFRA